MKSTGVLRRIDDLGRIVIPKEIRRNLRIRDGEYLEIYIEDNTIKLKKHSMVDNISEIAQLCVDSIYDISKINIIITDRDKIIASSGIYKKKYIKQKISSFLTDIILNRKSLISDKEQKINIIDEEEEKGRYIIEPLIIDGDTMGAVIVITVNKELTTFDEKIVNFVLRYIIRYIE